MRPICKCGRNCRYNGFNSDGSRRYKKFCSSCERLKYTGQRGNSEKDKAKNRERSKIAKLTTHGGYVKLSFCECCGFVAQHRCQLDVDHKDANHKNNNPFNLQTLCANCHRLKTWKNRDHIKS